jgi:hypothetical protein
MTRVVQTMMSRPVIRVATVISPAYFIIIFYVFNRMIPIRGSGLRFRWELGNTMSPSLEVCDRMHKFSEVLVI